MSGPQVPLSSIAVRGIRGIKHEVTLSLDGRSLLLHGDNGTGKSSFERALRWVLLGEEEPTADAPHTTEQSYRRHVSVPADYPRVQATFTDNGTITVTPGSVDCSGGGDKLRAACRRAWPFLRRTELLDVLSSRPVDRFRYFESFLGLDDADAVIQELSTGKSTSESRRTQALARATNALDPIAAFLPSEYEKPRNAEELDTAARKWATALSLLRPQDSLEDLAARAREAAVVGASGELLRARADVERIISDGQALRASIESAAAGRDVVAMLARRAELLKTVTGAAEADVIEHALQHFRRSEGEACPVCLQPIDWDATRAALQERAHTLGELKALTSQLDELARSVKQALDGVTHLAARLQAVSVLKSVVDPLADAVGIKALAGVDWSSRDARIAGLRVAGPSPYGPLAAAAELIVAEAEQRLLQMPSINTVPQVQSLAAFLDKVVRVGSQLRLIESEIANLNREIELQVLLLNAMRRARQDVAKKTLSAIQDNVADYYFAIHPRGGSDDVTGAPSIDVQRHGKGTAFVRGEFSGRQVKDPKWVYSDGHLDTVGICIFLALRRHRADGGGDPKIMVLDDIIISIDLGHARRLIELLRATFSDHQIVILTHNGLFAHWCKSLFPGLKRIQIKAWSLETGPRLGEYRTALEKITSSLHDGTAKDIAVALMEFLDEWTAEARYAYSVAVPAKTNEQYTLTEIWEPLVSRIRKLGKALNSDLGKAVIALETLKDVTAVRNQLGAHENEFAKEYPRAVMVEVATAACQLVAALYCPECQGFVVPTPNYSAPAMMHCPGHHVQYALVPKTS